MTKQEFIDKINNTCEELNIPLSYIIEHSLKISNNFINSDKVNISFSKEDLTYENVLILSSKIFINPNIKDFIKNIYKDHSNSIQRIFFGISNNNKELYFYIEQSQYKSDNIISYDETENKIYTYNSFYTKNGENYIINKLIDSINQYPDLIPYINTFKEYIKSVGFIKNNNIFYIPIFEYFNTDSSLKVIEELCKKINPNEVNNITNWFLENENNKISWLGYSIINDKLTLNVYTQK